MEPLRSKWGKPTLKFGASQFDRAPAFWGKPTLQSRACHPNHPIPSDPSCAHICGDMSWIPCNRFRFQASACQRTGVSRAEMADDLLDRLDALGQEAEPPEVIDLDSGSGDDGVQRPEPAAARPSLDVVAVVALRESPGEAPRALLGAQDIDRIGELGDRRQPPAKRKFAQRSAEAMAHAREALERKRRKIRDAARNSELEAARSQLQAVTRNFPAVATACGGLGLAMKRTNVGTICGGGGRGGGT